MFEKFRSSNLVELTPECFKLFTCSRLFDRDWYIRTFPDVLDSNLSPELHYLLVGGFSGYDPCAAFNSTTYLESYPDAVESKLNPLIHFLLIGQKEHRKVTISEKDPGELYDFHWVVFEHVRVMGEVPDIFHPVTFSEKIQAYKLFYRDPLAHKLADKVAVRDYVSEKIGSHYLVPLVGIYSHVDEIDINSLPDRFVMKAAHSSGWNYFCDNKAEMNWEAVKNQFRIWLSDNYYHYYREWVYKDIPPRIIIEHLLTSNTKAPPRDYKFFCFNGEPAYVHVDYDRFTKHRRNFYSIDWEFLSISYKYPPTEIEKRPENLEEMVKIAHVLSEGLPFARVDLYSIPEIYFGEITFNPGAGFGKFTPDEWNTKSMAGLHLESMIKKIPDNAYDDTSSALENVHVDPLGADFYLYNRFAEAYRGFTETLAAAVAAQTMRNACTFVDVGAHFGLYSVLAGKSHPGCRILAFEAVPENARLTRQNLDANGVTAQVITAAVGSESGERNFEFSIASDGSGFKADPDCEIIQTIPVQTVRLDEYKGTELNNPLFVKIDSGGSELDVLVGMRGLLAERSDTRLLIRFDPCRLLFYGINPIDLCSEISAQGFRYYFIDEERRQWNGLAMGENWLKPGYLFCVESKRAMSLCIFASSPELSGVNQWIKEWVKTQVKEQGLVISAVVPGNGALAEELRNAGTGLVIYTDGSGSGCADPNGQVGELGYEQIFALFEQVRVMNPDVILTVGFTPLGALVSRQLNLPHVWLTNITSGERSDAGVGDLEVMLREASNFVMDIVSGDIKAREKDLERWLFNECLSLKGQPNLNSRRLVDFLNILTVKWMRQQREETRLSRASLEAIIQAHQEVSTHAEQLRGENQRLKSEIERLNLALQDLLGSKSWRVTKLLREISRCFTGN